MNWRELPFVRISIPFIGGLILAFNLKLSLFPFSFYALCSLGFILLLLRFARIAFPYRQYFGLVAMLFLIFFGYQYSYFFLDENQPNHFESSLSNKNWIEAKVSHIRWTDKNVQLKLRLSSIKPSEGEKVKCSGNLMLYVKPDELPGVPNYGDVVKGYFYIRPIRSAGNPKAFDFQQFMRGKNIAYTAFPVNADWSLTESEGTFNGIARARSMQEYGLQKLRPHLPSQNEWSVAKALILGHRDQTAEAIKTAYTASGAIHVLAVSGLHVGIVYLMLNSLFWWMPAFPTYKWIKTILILLGVWSFALLTGASASVLRSATMFSFLIIGQTLNRHSNIYNTLAASAFFLLLINPLLLFDIGFQLSYLALFGIIYFQPKIYQLAFIQSRLGDFIWKLFTVAIAAQITTAPISMYYFHQFPSYFWLSGLVVIPAAMLILNLGFLLIFISGIPFLSLWIGKLLFKIIWACNQLIFFIENLPGSTITDIWINLGEVILLYTIIASVAVAISFKQFRALIVALIFGCIFSVNYAVKQWEIQHYQGLVVYNIRQHSAIDLILRNNIISISNPDLDASKRTWITQGFRSAHQMDSLIQLNFQDGLNDEIGFINYEKGLLQIGASKIWCITKNTKSWPQSESIDYVLLMQNTGIDLPGIIQRYRPEKIIFDASNSSAQIELWEATCHEMNQQYVNINSSGAFQLKL
jgi:competence protein ComEC